MSAIDLEWQNFISNSPLVGSTGVGIVNPIPTSLKVADMPKCGDIYISTKTKISYLNTSVPLGRVFWEVPVIPYTTPSEGVVKKQMKFNCFSEDESSALLEKTKGQKCLDNFVISKVEGNQGRAKYRDIRKISIGLCKRDVTNYRSREKSAFYNCFVLILRIIVDDVFREVHVKVFNTGKLEIPGIQSDGMLNRVLDVVLHTLEPLITMSDGAKLAYSDNCDTVLINSNFNCGFYVNRERLFDILKGVYKLQCNYDACSYPGVQSKYYYYDDTKSSNGRQDAQQVGEGNKVSFMVFRTGSVLIVGKCSEPVIMEVYEFIKGIFQKHYHEILDPSTPVGDQAGDTPRTPEKRKKLRRFAKIALDPDHTTSCGV